MKITWPAAILFASAAALAQSASGIERFMRDMQISMTKMDKAMSAAPMNGNVDHDFAAMMLPHHVGAIDMAKAELAYGKDPVMRRLAEEIIVDQQSEIDSMNLWLDKNRHQPAHGGNAR